MRRSRGRGVQIDTLADFDHRLAAGATTLRGWRVRELDLSARSAELRDLRLAGALFLGCRFAPGDAARAEARGAIVVPDLRGAPVDLHLDHLYRPEDLYDTPSYAESLDARAYAWSQTAHDRDASMAKALHDHAVDEALTDWVAGRRLVGVMGGHALERGTPGYRDAARLGQRLGVAHVVATGGGPGAMEAANFGAYVGGIAETGGLDESLDLLAEVPSFRPSVEAWVRAGFTVRERFPGGADSLGHPHLVLRPRTAQRDGQRDREVRPQRPARGGPAGGLPCRHRVPPRRGRDRPGGLPGRLRELLRRRVLGRSDGPGRPCVLDRDLPAWPLLKALARGRPMEQHVHLVDDVDAAAALFAG